MSLQKYLPTLLARGMAVSYEIIIDPIWSSLYVHLIVPDEYDRVSQVSIMGNSIVFGSATDGATGEVDDPSFQTEDLMEFLALAERLHEINEWLTERYANR